MTSSSFRWLASATMLLIALGFASNASSQDGRAAEAGKLYEQSVELYQQGNYRDGTPLAKRALEIREQALGEEHPDTAAALGNLASFYRVSGAFDQAEPLYKRALAIREKISGLDHPDTAEALNGLGNLYYSRGAYAQAEPLQQRALAIREKVLGPNDRVTAKSLTNLGDVYLATAAYSQAEPLYQRALTILEKAAGPEHPDTASTMNNLALLYKLMGVYTKSESLFQRALTIREKVLGPEHPNTATSLMNLATLYQTTGANAKAEPLFQRALTIREKVLGPDNVNTARVASNLGIVYAAMGKHAKAATLFQRSLAITEKALGPEHPDTSSGIHNLAAAYHDMGEFGKAEPLYQRALELRDRVLGPAHPLTASTRYDLANLYRETGAYAKARPLYERALAGQEQTLGTEHPETADSVVNLAMLQWAMGSTAKALPLLQRAQGIHARNSERFLVAGSESRNQAYLASVAGAVFKNVSFSIAVAGRDSAALGLTSVLQYKGRVLDAASDSVGHLRQSVQPDDRALFEQLAAVASEFSTLTYQGAGRLSAEAYRKRLDELARQQDTLEAELGRRSSEFRRQVLPATLTRVRSTMPADAVLVEWFRYRPFDPKARVGEQLPRYAAYVLRRTGNAVAIDLGKAEEVEALVQKLRASVSDPERSDVRQSAAALSDRMIKPLHSHLAGARHLMLSPDGALNLVPMAALLDEQGRFLAERFEITLLTSGRDLLRVAAAEPTLSSNSVVLADPDFGRRAAVVARTERPAQPLQQRSEEIDRGGGLSFRPLPGAAQEGEAIKTLLRNEKIRVLTRAAATEANLKQVHGPRILHLATHGFFLSDQEARTAAPDSVVENPLLRSGLALAGANERRSGMSDDGILTALEASRLDLRGTELVVLSACETGVGEVRSGDGISGLRRSLLLAGAQSQVASLWKVADLPTKQLMVSMYEHLLKGEGRSAALRSAQREMLAIPEQSHPYYWASFVSIGAWAPLSRVN